MREALRAGMLAACCALLPVPAGHAQQHPDVPYVPTPPNVVEAMLDVADVHAGDYLIDLGSGDGRVVLAAVRRQGVRGIGIDLDANLVSTANREAERLGVGRQARFVSGNLFNFDFSDATVLTMYLLPKLNIELRPRILARLRPGTRIVSHDFDMGRWRPDVRREVAVPNKSYGPPVSQVYLWFVPADVSGKWHWRVTAGGSAHAYEATITQTFQDLHAEATLDGGGMTTRLVHLQGDAITLALSREVAGRHVTHEFNGKVDGDRIVGHAAIAAEAAPLAWQATRIARGKVNHE